jgi:hypothetical protein
LGGDPSAHDNYYAKDPRNVGEMVEKSKKKPFWDAKFGKKRVFLGDRVLEPQRERSSLNDLRAPQATLTAGRGLLTGMALNIMRPRAGACDPGMVSFSSYDKS